nr:hypothetical protein [Nocardioides ungokensis]
MTWAAVVARTERTTLAGQSWRERSSAAVPVVYAVAAEVPDTKSQRVSRTDGGTAPSRPTPGATTSGFSTPAVGSPPADHPVRRAGGCSTPTGRRATRPWG